MTVEQFLELNGYNPYICVELYEHNDEKLLARYKDPDDGELKLFYEYEYRTHVLAWDSERVLFDTGRIPNEYLSRHVERWNTDIGFLSSKRPKYRDDNPAYPIMQIMMEVSKT